MSTACGFWMMKIITTVRPAMAAISPVRAPLIRVCSRRRAGAGTETGGGGAESLAAGGGRVAVVGRGAAGSVMTLSSQKTGTGPLETGRFP